MRLSGSAVALAVVITFGACVSCGSAHTGASPAAVHAVADTVVPMLTRDFPASYAGIETDEGNGVLIVYRIPDKALDEAVRARAQGVYVDFRDAKFPLVRMREVSDRIAADMGYWRERGTEITLVGPRPDGSGVEVHTANGNITDQVAALGERYGADIIHVMQGTAPVPQPFQSQIVLPSS